ncbi:AbrB family looped-hinge helix DNA binding protein [Saccharopolyspora lacisalsi]|uniref:AbrB family looped-hinge helix DNA binding protein n=1 Tax=Halosaccharopolyspora lacisalsi TaxID=1000566 RepID=A0A839DWX5_9PSEU|nr:AbrB/MazE/SpoVT family DNA-binding domain-containing protein [Halosaccharopolyspora lacisalsi]MBA8825380.1 AbrB family looped-hinge helix DNA binding protein [Halosaccharopolyspora lacisalsi]
MRVTEKGQATIPVDKREQYGIMPGDEVEFVDGEDALVLRRSHASPNRGRRLVGHLTGRAGGEGMSTDEIMELTRGERA